jgi:hypothetical protein
VIEHVDLQDSGSFGKSAGQLNISFARCRISRGMVVLCELNDYVIRHQAVRMEAASSLVWTYAAAAHNSCAFPARSCTEKLAAYYI